MALPHTPTVGSRYSAFATFSSPRFLARSAKVAERAIYFDSICIAGYGHIILLNMCVHNKESSAAARTTVDRPSNS